MEINKPDVYPRLSAQMKEVLAIQQQKSKDAFATTEDPEMMRLAYNAERTFWNEGGPEMTRSLDRTVSGPHGDIPIRLHYPNTDSLNKVILFAHGGGWVVGNLETHDRIMRNIAAECQAVVVGIDYRLAPEFKFPTPIEECVAVIDYLKQNAAEHGLAAENISLAGDSGGAAISLSTALYLRDKRGAGMIKTLLLFYGAFGLADSMSRRLHGSKLDGLTSEDIAYYMNVFIKEEDRRSRYCDCFSSDMTTGVPPAYLAVSDIDPLIDDSRLLKAILDEHGGICRYDEYQGVLHGFMHYSKILDAANQVFVRSAQFYKENS